MDQLARVCERIAASASRLRKIALLADYFRTLDDAGLLLAVRFLSAGPTSEGNADQTLFGPSSDAAEKQRLSIGYATIREALEKVVEWDRDTIRLCYQEVGDSGETIGLLLRGHSLEKPLTLAGANEVYQQLFRARLTSRKVELLAETFRTYQPLTMKYFVKVINGNLRIGLMAKMVEEAVALSAGVPTDAISEANNRLGDLAQVAFCARAGTLHAIKTRIFHPMDFMLAKPLDHVDDLPAPAEWFVEDKYDGIRSQVHMDHGQVKIFSRGMEDVSSGFPEILRGFSRATGGAILDGELLAWREGRALNFNVLQQRIARKRVRASLMLEVPVVFVAYDVLYSERRLMTNEPLETRRAALEELIKELKSRSLEPDSLVLSPQTRLTEPAALEQHFREARARGNEGLVLKRSGTLYEGGKRSGAWMKLKRPFASLDVVVTAAEQGHGRRATVFSDYTFAVRSQNGYVNVGKAYSGLTDAEIKQLTKIFRSSSVERFGRVMLVKPEVVLEVAFDGIQKSSRHKSGFALRFPRIVRWRQDKRPEEVDDLARVESLYESTLKTGEGPP
jgi:DNA ligase 1